MPGRFVAIVAATLTLSSSITSVIANEEVPRNRRIVVQNEIGQGIRSEIRVLEPSGREVVVGSTNDQGVVELRFGCPAGSHVLARAVVPLYIVGIPRPKCAGETIRILLILVRVSIFDDLGTRYLKSGMHGFASIAFNEANYRAYLVQTLWKGEAELQDQLLGVETLGLGERIQSDLQWVRTEKSEKFLAYHHKLEGSLADLLRELRRLSEMGAEPQQSRKLVGRYFSLKAYSSASFELREPELYRFDPLQEKEVLSKSGANAIRRVQVSNSIPVSGNLDIATIRMLANSDVFPVIKEAYAALDKGK